MKLFTIGFTNKSASRFFDLLRGSGVKRILDVRINNGSQLAGFAKKDDLAYFLREICRMDYVHLPDLGAHGLGRAWAARCTGRENPRTSTTG